MNTTNELSTKPRSTRYTDEQLRYFAELEKIGRNVSHFVRQAVDEKIKREQPQAAN